MGLLDDVRGRCSSGSAAPGLAPVPASAWTVTSAEGRVLPSYQGSDSYTFVPLLLDIRRAAHHPAFTPRVCSDLPLSIQANLRAGPAKVRLRRESDDDDLRGLGDVDWTLEAGAFAEFWPTQWLRGRAELRQGIGGHHGLMSDLMADVVVPVTPQLTLSGGPRMTLASGKALSPYFSVTPQQSAASGLPVYDVGGGVYSYGAGAQVRYAWSPQWATHVFVEYERLAHDAANSPLVTQLGSRDQVRVGLGVTYSFDMRALW
jgi:outer membrane protein